MSLISTGWKHCMILSFYDNAMWSSEWDAFFLNRYLNNIFNKILSILSIDSAWYWIKSNQLFYSPNTSLFHSYCYASKWQWKNSNNLPHVEGHLATRFFIVLGPTIIRRTIQEFKKWLNSIKLSNLYFLRECRDLSLCSSL